MKARKILSIIVLLTLLISTLAGCRQSQQGEQKLTKVTFAASKNPWSALVIIALKKGYFKEEGLDVNLEYVQAAKFAMDALVAGSSQFSNVVETNVAFLGYTGNTNVEVIGTVCEANDGAIIARRDAGITSPKDLEGKKLGILQGTTSQIYADRFIEKHGLDPSKVQIVNLTPVVMQSSVANKEIDAGSIWQPFIFNVQQQLGVNAVVFADRDVYTALMNVAVNKDWASKNPETVKAALRALLKAENFAKTDRNSAIEIVGQEVAIDKNVMAQIWDQYTYRLSLPGKVLQEIKREGEWIQKSQPGFQGKSMPSYEGYLNGNFLKTVAPDRVE